MVFFVIPVGVIAAIILCGVSVGAKIWDLDLMPFISGLSLFVSIVSCVAAFLTEDDARRAAVAVAVIGFLLFLITAGGSMTVGGMLSWIWYRI